MMHPEDNLDESGAVEEISRKTLHPPEVEHCGYNETPHIHQPQFCGAGEPASHKEECCTWIIEGFYSECAESWCYAENECAWQLRDSACYPI